MLVESALNEDCFREIIKNLEICDLLSICNLDKQNDRKSFTKFVGQVVSKIQFDMEKIKNQQPEWSENRVFKTFGKVMTKLKVSLKLKLK